MKREHFYTKDLHFAAYLLLEGYEPELKFPFPNARKVVFEYLNAEFTQLRDLRTKFEGDKTLTVSLLDYVSDGRRILMKMVSPEYRDWITEISGFTKHQFVHRVLASGLASKARWKNSSEV